LQTQLKQVLHEQDGELDVLLRAAETPLGLSHTHNSNNKATIVDVSGEVNNKR
jgi:hypothetical protein